VESKTSVDVVVTELDKIAHELYVRQQEKDGQSFSLALKIFVIGHSYLQISKEYYDKAELILREKKIKKICHGIK
jgi:hypothetical protein